jgi:hypothetical protein
MTGIIVCGMMRFYFCNVSLVIFKKFMVPGKYFHERGADKTAPFFLLSSAQAQFHMLHSNCKKNGSGKA